MHEIQPHAQISFADFYKEEKRGLRSSQILKQSYQQKRNIESFVSKKESRKSVDLGKKKVKKREVSPLVV